ncbi:MAG: cysteine desulfurase [Candidatus Atribacteria bacterium]|nr:cysteine desulfurase [Candidatus Atribacteria bacterium]
MFDEKMIYLDNASATRLDERVLEAMQPYFFKTYAVATSEFGYSQGIEAREALQEARESIASKLNAESKEFIFTSGNTESSNMAIKGIMMALQKKNKNHLIISKIEDFPILYSTKYLEKQGMKVTYLDVDNYGFIDLAQLKDSISKNTAMVSIQHANQEIGTIQNIEKISQVCKERKVIFHTDATHTFTRLAIDVKKIPVDLISVSAHTIHGPKGVGGLYVREGTPLIKWMDGGFQEFNKRAGLENIPGAVGFAQAVKLVTGEENEQLIALRDYLISHVLAEIPQTTLNGHPKRRTPQNANITFHFIEGESITLHLDMNGFSVSTGSACFSRSLEASHVILGIGGDHERAHGSIRFTLGRYNNLTEIKKLIKTLKEIISELRKISPLGKD